MIGNRVVSGARRDDIGSAATINRVRPCTARDDIGLRGTRNGNARSNRRGIDVLEIRDSGEIPRRLVAVRQIDGGGRLHDQRVGASTAIDGTLCSIIKYGIVARAGIDRVGASTAIDSVRTGAGADQIRERRSCHLQ